MSKLGSLRRLSWTSRGVLVEAAFAIPAMHLLVRVLGVRRLHDALAGATSTRVSRQLDTGVGAWTQVRDVSRLVAMAARHSPGDSTCLHRSMALWWMLRRRGFGGQLHMGVRKGNGSFEAHAWVAYAGVVLNDDPEVEQRYAPLSWRSAERDV